MLHSSQIISAYILQVLLNVVVKEYCFCIYCHWEYILPFGPGNAELLENISLYTSSKLHTLLLWLLDQKGLMATEVSEFKKHGK